MENSEKNNPMTAIRVYGWTVLRKKPHDKHWIVEADEEFSVLPSHYDFPEQAEDRVTYLRERGYLARTMALVAERTEKELDRLINEQEKTDEQR